MSRASPPEPTKKASIARSISTNPVPKRIASTNTTSMDLSAGDARFGNRIHPRRYRAGRRPQFESDGAHGRGLRRSYALAISGVSVAWRRSFLAGVFATAQRESRAARTEVRCLRSRSGRIEIIFHAEFFAEHF